MVKEKGLLNRKSHAEIVCLHTKIVPKNVRNLFFRHKTAFHELTNTYDDKSTIEILIDQ